MEAKVVQVRDDSVRSGIRLAGGHKWVRVIFPDAGGIAITRYRLGTFFADPVYRNGQPYCPKRAARKLLAMGKRFGITKGARQALRGILK